LRLGSVGADHLDGINLNDWRGEQLAGAGDVCDALYFVRGVKILV
jgi:hypothetical protein